MVSQWDAALGRCLVKRWNHTTVDRLGNDGRGGFGNLHSAEVELLPDGGRDGPANRERPSARRPRRDLTSIRGELGPRVQRAHIEPLDESSVAGHVNMAFG